MKADDFWMKTCCFFDNIVLLVTSDLILDLPQALDLFRMLGGVMRVLVPMWGEIVANRVDHIVMVDVRDYAIAATMVNE